MKKIISVIVATLVAMSFTAAAFAADAVAPVTTPAADAKPAIEKKDDSKPCDCNKTKKHKKHKKAKKEVKPAPEAAPAAK
jgi:Ni/Co efflux regulator RcnB